MSTPQLSHQVIRSIRDELKRPFRSYPEAELDEVLGRAPKRMRQVDPDGSEAIALFLEHYRKPSQ